jgi:hypothetical protein
LSSSVVVGCSAAAGSKLTTINHTIDSIAPLLIISSYISSFLFFHSFFQQLLHLFFPDLLTHFSPSFFPFHFTSFNLQISFHNPHAYV